MPRLFVGLLWVDIALLVRAVVTKDVPDYGLILGNPAKLSGFMSRHGHKLMKKLLNDSVTKGQGKK